MTPEPVRAAGWYDDETDAALLRYWNGAEWSPHTAPRPTDAAVDAVPAGETVPADETVLAGETVPAGGAGPAFGAIDEVTSVRPRPATPEEHTTVPLPPDSAASGASGPAFSYEPYRAAGRTFLATWLFALLLGYWGADRFYLGKIGTAILKLVTIGGLGVWVLVDLVLVLVGAQRDREGRPLEGYEENKRVAWIVTGAIIVLGLVTSAVANLIAFAVR